MRERFAVTVQFDNLRIDMGEDVRQCLARRHVAFLHAPWLDLGLELLKGIEFGL